MVFEKLIKLQPYMEAKRLGVYLSMPAGEIRTDAIVRHALESGKQVFVPYLQKSDQQSPDTPRSVMDMVDLRTIADYNSLRRDTWGIPTIPADTVHERQHILKGSTTNRLCLDLILMPGVAFDLDPTSGFVRRLGHGKGFYDYFLHQYLESRGSPSNKTLVGPETNVLFYGLALKEQLLPSGTGCLSVPVGPYDKFLHGLLVGDGEVKEYPDHKG